jgi:hypothetical protein
MPLILRLNERIADLGDVGSDSVGLRLGEVQAAVTHWRASATSRCLNARDVARMISAF